MKVIGILIDPKGEEWFDAYGPKTKERDKATILKSEEAANNSAVGRFGRAGIAFFESERQAENEAFKRYHGWTNRTERIP